MERRASSTLRASLGLLLLLLLFAEAAAIAAAAAASTPSTTTRSSTTKTSTTTTPAAASSKPALAPTAPLPFVVGATFTVSSPSVVTLEQRAALEAALPECAGVAEGTTATASSTASSACG